MTTVYRIENATSGHTFGLYLGTDEDMAIQAMLDDAGHDGPADEDIIAVELYELTASRLEALRCEAAAAGDSAQVALCDAALAGDVSAATECARVIAEAMAQDDE